MLDGIDKTDKYVVSLEKNFMKGDLGSLDTWHWGGMTLSPNF